MVFDVSAFSTRVVFDVSERMCVFYVSARIVFDVSAFSTRMVFVFSAFFSLNSLRKIFKKSETFYHNAVLLLFLFTLMDRFLRFLICRPLAAFRRSSESNESV